MGYDQFLLDCPQDIWKLLPHTLAVVVSEGKWIAFNYLIMLSHIIASAVARGGGRILVSVPPRHGKSWFVSQWLCVWFLTNWPDLKVILATYEARFAATWGRRVRNIIKENSKKLGISLSDDSTAADNWELVSGGGMITAGVGGPITGKGGHLLLVDDPHKNWQEAQSETMRENVKDWFDSTLYTRAEPGATIVVLHTRWQEDDLIGYLMREKISDGWFHIRIPALAELEDDPLGREIGEALCPERYDTAALNRIKNNMSSLMWAALFQQRPAPMSGNIWLRENWKFYTIPPRCNFILQSWDTASKQKLDSARSICQTWGVSDKGAVLLDRWGDKVQYPQLRKQVDIMFWKFRPNIILIEDKDSGKALIQALQQETTFPVLPVIPTVDKAVRAVSVTPMQESGRVWIPDPGQPDSPPWVKDFIEDCALFPNGMYLDDVDAMSQALTYIMTMAGVGTLRTAMPRRTTSLLENFRMVM